VTIYPYLIIIENKSLSMQNLRK